MLMREFQAAVSRWVIECLGYVVAHDKPERHHRFLEEALELVQVTGCTQAEAHQLVDYVYGRPVGDIRDEVGGTLTTLAALCQAHSVDMATAAEKTLSRNWVRIEAIREKQKTKPKHGPLPGVAPGESS